MVLVASLAALAAGALLVAAVAAAARLVSGEGWALSSAGLLFIAGTVPPTVCAVLWYARAADYRWAISGPGVFAHLGGGPAMVALTVATLVVTVVCWGAALWFALRGIRGVQDG